MGGGGLGILSPYGHNAAQIVNLGHTETPETPETPNILAHPLTEGDGVAPKSLRTEFERQGLTELTAWAEALGRWLYV